jgi:hypothetical protein
MQELDCRDSGVSSTRTQRLLAGCLLALVGAATVRTAAADDASAGNGFFADWFARSDAAKESQPHWMTPVITVTPRLEQEFRYDQSWQSRAGGVDLTNYGGGKGLELIPAMNTEVILGVPAYQIRDPPKGSVEGWGDLPLLVKYRFLSANEENGNYILTGFLGVSVPTGSAAFTSNHYQYTPTIAGGKGWGDRHSGFNIQSTLAITIPDGDTSALGMPIVWNTAFQGHVFEKLWPEIEVNYTAYHEGPNDGKHQLALAAGLVLGRYELGPRVRFIVGGAYQRAVSSFRTFEHTWILTTRLAF